MADLSAFSLSKMFSSLTGKKVSVASTSSLPTAGALVYGEYLSKPGDVPMVVKSDLAVVASLGGALLGLPKATVDERLKQTTLDEGLRDAMHEVLNVTSTPLSFQHRVVFQAMRTDDFSCSDGVRTLLAKPIRIDRFEVSVEGYAKGLFAVYSDV